MINRILQRLSLFFSEGVIPINAIAVFSKIDKIKPFYDMVYFIVLQICKLFLVGTILVTCYMVASRFIGFIPPSPWTEEVILTLIGYVTLLSASLAIRRSAHIRMVALDPYINKKVLKALDLLADIGIMYLSILFITTGWAFAVQIGERGFFTSMPTVSLFWRFFPVPLGGVFMLFFNIEVTYKHIKAFFVKEEENNG